MADSDMIERFNLKISRRKPQERELGMWMKADLDSGEINLSSVIKDLLHEWYQRRWATGSLNTSLGESAMLALPAPKTNGSGHSQTVPGEVLEDPDDELVRRMAGINFEF